MAAQHSGQKPVLAVGHAGWINAASMIAARQEAPKIAADWPQAVNYLQCRKLVFQPKKLTVYNSQLFE